MRKIKIFGHPWHLAHQYELSKIPFIEWTWLRQYKRPYTDKARGDFMINWVDSYEEGKYDVALLHLDQQCVEDQIWERGKGTLYRELNEVIQDIPKIVLMHGTTYYPEKFSRDEIIERVKEIVGDNTMVTNSEQTAKDFGFGTPIIHGMDPKEWNDNVKEIRAVTMISPAGLDKYYDRSFLSAIKDRLLEKGIMHCHITVDWQAKDWEDYKNFLGSSLIYIHPSKESCMPRARTEAMMSGCCVLTTPWHDIDKYIEDGVNGFIIPRNPDVVADLVVELFNDRKRAIEIGQRGKETILKELSVEKYQNEWKKLLEKVLNTKI